jgi:hypothetical protein
MANNHEIYRCTTLGAALVDTLDELINGQQLTENLAMLVLCQFDRSVHNLLNTSLRNRATVKVIDLKML